MPFRDSFEPDGGETIAEINATPLIDVLLVLLIMVIITVPVRPHLIDMTLPTDAAPPAMPPRTVTIEVEAGGLVRWDGEALAGASSLDARLDQIGRAADQPEIHLRGDALAPYGAVAAVMAAAQRHEIRKFGLVDTARPSK